MACNPVTLAGIARECENNIGGIRKVYVNLKDYVTTTLNGQSEEIASVAISGSNKFKTFEFRKNSSNLTSTLNVSDNGSKYWTSDLVMYFSRMETAKRTAINALAAAEAVAIVEDMNGKVWFLGYDEPVEASAGSGETGTARDDANQYSITLQDTSVQSPYEINATFWAASGSALVS